MEIHPTRQGMKWDEIFEKQTPDANDTPSKVSLMRERKILFTLCTEKKALHD